MPDYGNRPRRRAAIKATERLHEQVGGGTRVAARRRVATPPNMETQLRRAQLPVGTLLTPSPVAVPDVHRVAIPPPPADAPPNRQAPPEDEHALRPVPNTVSTAPLTTFDPTTPMSPLGSSQWISRVHGRQEIGERRIWASVHRQAHSDNACQGGRPSESSHIREAPPGDGMHEG